jgi:H/ACA ribonucleoprotein complex subunit 4
MVKGIITLNKPSGMTSFEACDAVRNKVGAKKAGHAGTLDPAVTGVLIVALNEAVKTLILFSHLDKTYQGTAHLHKDIEETKLKHEIKKFMGKIIQLPPRKSRVNRQEREREIYEFKLIKKKGKDFSFQVHCEAGTYIRKLIHDLGMRLGGAHMTSLRRIKQGPFSEKESTKLEKIDEINIIPIEKAIKRLEVPLVSVSATDAKALRQGKFIKIKGKAEGTVVVFSQSKIVALARQEKGFLKPKRVI